MIAVHGMRRKKKSVGAGKGKYSYMSGSGDESGLIDYVKRRRRLHFASVSEYCVCDV